MYVSDVSWLNIPVKYSTWWFKNFVFFVGTFFLIHLAMVYSSFDGFSTSTSDPGPVYSWKWKRWVHELVYKMYERNECFSENQNKRRWHILWVCLSALENKRIDRMRSKRRPHTKLKNVGIIVVSWFVLIYRTREMSISSYDFYVYDFIMQQISRANRE